MPKIRPPTPRRPTDENGNMIGKRKLEFDLGLQTSSSSSSSPSFTSLRSFSSSSSEDVVAVRKRDKMLTAGKKLKLKSEVGNTKLPKRKHLKKIATQSQTVREVKATTPGPSTSTASTATGGCPHHVAPVACPHHVTEGNYVDVGKMSARKKIEKLAKRIMEDQLREGVPRENLKMMPRNGSEPVADFLAVPRDCTERLQRILSPVRIHGPNFLPEDIGAGGPRYHPENETTAENIEFIAKSIQAMERAQFAIMNHLHAIHRTQEIHSLAHVEHILKTETVRAMLGGHTMDSKVIAVLRECRRFILLRTNETLQAIPFESVDAIEEFFTTERNSGVLAEFVQNELPIDTHFATAVTSLLLTPDLHKLVNWSNRKTT